VNALREHGATLCVALIFGAALAPVSATAPEDQGLTVAPFYVANEDSGAAGETFLSYGEWRRQRTQKLTSEEFVANYLRLMELITGPGFAELGYEGRAGALYLAAEACPYPEKARELLGELLAEYPGSYCLDLAHLSFARMARSSRDTHAAAEHYRQACRLADERGRTWLADLAGEAADVIGAAWQVHRTDTATVSIRAEDVADGVFTAYGGLSLGLETDGPRKGVHSLRVEGSTDVGAVGLGCVTLELDEPQGAAQASLFVWCADQIGLSCLATDTDGTMALFAFPPEELPTDRWAHLVMDFAKVPNSGPGNNVMEEVESLTIVSGSEGEEAGPTIYIDSVELQGGGPVRMRRAPFGDEAFSPAATPPVHFEGIIPTAVTRAFGPVVLSRDETIRYRGRPTLHMAAQPNGRETPAVHFLFGPGPQRGEGVRMWLRCTSPLPLRVDIMHGDNRTLRLVGPDLRPDVWWAGDIRLRSAGVVHSAMESLGQSASCDADDSADLYIAGVEIVPEGERPPRALFVRTPDNPPGGLATDGLRWLTEGAAEVEEETHRLKVGANAVRIGLSWLPEIFGGSGVARSRSGDDPAAPARVVALPRAGSFEGGTLRFWCYPFHRPGLRLLVTDRDGTAATWTLHQDELQRRAWNEVIIPFAELRNAGAPGSDDVMQSPQAVYFMPPREIGVHSVEDVRSASWIIDDLKIVGPGPATVGALPLRASYPRGTKIMDTGDDVLWIARGATVSPEEEIVAEGDYSARVEAPAWAQEVTVDVVPRREWTGDQLSFAIRAPDVAQAVVVVGTKEAELAILLCGQLSAPTPFLARDRLGNVIQSPVQPLSVRIQNDRGDVRHVASLDEWTRFSFSLDRKVTVSRMQFRLQPVAGWDGKVYIDEVRLTD